MSDGDRHDLYILAYQPTTASSTVWWAVACRPAIIVLVRALFDARIRALTIGYGVASVPPVTRGSKSPHTAMPPTAVPWESGAG